MSHLLVRKVLVLTEQTDSTQKIEQKNNRKNSRITLSPDIETNDSKKVKGKE